VEDKPTSTLPYLHTSTHIMRRALEIAVIAAVVAVGSLSAGKIARQDSPAPSFSHEEFYIVPVRVHLMRLNDRVGIGTKLKKEDVERIFRKANGIWHAAGIHLWVESIVEEKPSGRTDSDTEAITHFRHLLDLRPTGSRAEGMFHVYYVGRVSINGLYVERDAIFVQEAAALTVVPGGIDEPLPRVTSHEIGHGFRLTHRQALTNLMASGTTGTSLNQEEIHTARRAAESYSWVIPAAKFLESADKLLSEGKKPESVSRCRAIISLPGSSPLKDRAKSSLDALAP